jgi:hypothetical protein
MVMCCTVVFFVLFLAADFRGFSVVHFLHKKNISPTEAFYHEARTVAAKCSAILTKSFSGKVEEPVVHVNAVSHVCRNVQVQGTSTGIFKKFHLLRRLYYTPR